ncbi:hypothetical protein VDGD_05484 [Verticillium dahliae]|nr:hypothetical protein VDGD_05484 [Verticillium dahliae]
MTRLDRAPQEDGDDIFASLWEEAPPFARLPADAPAELRQLVADIENPRRVYAVYRASRRHNFQLLVERYVAQLRYGCDSETCVTATCFTCRRRIAGKAPLRRYNTTSARTLAVCLASQDNPENGLCPYLKPSKEPAGALNSLIFAPRHSSQSFSDPFAPRSNNITRKNSDSRRPGAVRCPPAERAENSDACQLENNARGQSQRRSASGRRSRFDSETGELQEPDVRVIERPISKDHRSFAANVFGTVAFKMLEWLTPSGLAAMAQKMDGIETDDKAEDSDDAKDPAPQTTPISMDEPPLSSSSETQTEQPEANLEPIEPELEVATEPSIPEKPNPTAPTPAVNVEKPRRKSSARVRATSSANPKRTIPIEPSPAFVEGSAPGITSPRLNGNVIDKVQRTPKAAAAKTRAIPDIPATPPFFDNVPPRLNDVTLTEEPKSMTRSEVCGVEMVAENKPVKRSSIVISSQTEDKPNVSPLKHNTADSGEFAIPEGILPQSLTTLNIDLVDLISDILQDDGTAESHLLEPATVTRSSLEVTDQVQIPRRLKGSYTTYPKHLKKQWKQFIEQSLFNILSDPEKLIASFVRDGELLDSHSLWYCMLRLTRVAPSLVFDSLWIASASLFSTSRIHQASRSSRRPDVLGPPVNNAQAGQLMAICLHALVAAAPLVHDTRTLQEMSRIRSNGLTLAGSGAIAKQPAWLCLQYEDAFSDDLVLRLAKRLFSAISARQYAAEMTGNKEGLASAPTAQSALQPLLAQLDLLSINTTPSLEFTAAERAVHEARASTLLLDWAKTVMLREWNGRPEISCNSSFGGAVALIAAMYEKRHSLLLGDAQFRVDFFADRLDSINMPVEWLSHKTTQHKKHMLDFPFIFNPSTLVSYFRSINFLRMSRSYEESSSLQTRMKAIVAPGGLITDPHHRVVLQDLLQTASGKFLVLDISRDGVVRDAFDQLWRREARELLRPLKVHLGEEGGEEGFDSGGVQQEFFRLAIAECLDPDFGAFTVDERTRMAWFVPGSIVPVWKFELLGILVSLAVYNGLTLPITFPKAMYRKLLGEPVDELHHIADGWPDLASGLTTLLEWDEKDGAVEDVFARTYEFSVSMFDQPISREMNSENPNWPQLKAKSESLAAQNPADAPLVTDENRNAYVSDYIRYLTDVSVRPQFEAFLRGFRACLHPKSLGLLTPPLLQSVVEGVQDIDIAELRRYTRYVGWDASHRAVHDFWSIVKRYDDTMKRRLLEFVTASDRVPVGGMRNLQFVVQKNGEEEGEGGHLPTAYTCYGTLLLPEYESKDVLRQRLAMALENSKGFGFA